MISSSKAGLGWYLEQIKSTPLLTAEEERQLSRRVREHSDPLARERMVRSNLRLVVKICKEYGGRGMSLSDLVAEGNLGLMRAVEEFDPDAGVRFSTYAAWWIKQSVKRALINAGKPICIPEYLSKLIGKWRRAASRLESSLGRPATVEEMAKAMQISRKKAEIIQTGLAAANSPTQMDSDETQAVSEVLEDENAATPDAALLKASDAVTVKKLLAEIEPRERKILELRFGLDGHDGPPRTFKEIGKIVGLTRERVRQLEKQALASLKELAETHV